jgi:hypothetical protein
VIYRVSLSLQEKKKFRKKAFFMRIYFCQSFKTLIGSTDCKEKREGFPEASELSRIGNPQ